MHRALRAVDQHGDAAGMRHPHHLLDGDDGAEHVRHMGDGDHLGARGEQRLEFVEQQLAVVGDRRPFQDRALPLLQEIPGHDVGMVLHDGKHDLVALPDMRGAIGARHQIDGFGGVAGEDDLGVGAGVDEAAHRLPRLLEIGGGEVAQVVEPAMDVGVFLSVGALNGVEHGSRLLRRGAVVEIDERLAMDLLRQDREVGADGIDVIGNGSCALLGKGFRQDRHGLSAVSRS